MLDLWSWSRLMFRLVDQGQILASRSRSKGICDARSLVLVKGICDARSWFWSRSKGICDARSLVLVKILVFGQDIGLGQGRCLGL
jgi:hypothetical protein